MSHAGNGRRARLRLLGSFGLLCYDFEGNEVWRKPIPMPVVEFGSSSSPILSGERLILNCDQDINSFLIALNKKTGQEIWRKDRGEFRRGFATPIIWRHDGLEELVVPGSLWLKSYDLADGKERWSYSGTSRVACSSPVAGDGLLFSASWNVGGDEGDRITMPRFKEVVAEYDQDKDGKFTLEELPKGPIRERFTQIDVNKDKLVTEEEWNGMADAFAKAENAVIAIRPGGRGDITKPRPGSKPGACLTSRPRFITAAASTPSKMAAWPPVTKLKPARRFIRTNASVLLAIFMLPPSLPMGASTLLHKRAWWWSLKLLIT